MPFKQGIPRSRPKAGERDRASRDEAAGEQLDSNVDVLVATAVTLGVSVGSGLLTMLTLGDGVGFSTRAALFMFTACPLVMVCVSASEPFMRRAAQQRARNARRRG
ncbi:hypothetical protein GCM10009760_20830 [Kitasatospora kazusensis]|uniref:MFS transporter n=1 Tax=Kitasatospora kazusensis TaxID=407974 RepID=A0ABN2ZAK4_9ACTN